MNNASERIASGSLTSERVVELSQRLTDSIDMARLMPGQQISMANLALHLRSSPTEVEAVLPEFVRKGLLSLACDSVVITPLDRTKLMQQMDMRAPLEKAIAQAAAAKATDAQKNKISGAVVLMKRSAMVGDMEGYMNADRALERLIGDAAAMPESFEQLVQIKREFRRAWCAHNRLRDLNIPAELRQSLAAAIAKSNAQEAVDAVENFLEYLRKAY
jgi:DNA-binding GntR family transcriptional regulator